MTTVGCGIHHGDVHYASAPLPGIAFQWYCVKNETRSEMLLTSAQISTAVSSGIVCMFTSLLFYSGYALQQRTVQEIRVAIQPQPTTFAPGNEIYNPLISDRKQQILSTYGTSRTNWKRVAYVRSVWEHDELCEAVMFFAELTSRKSKGQKVLLYPAEWDLATASPARDTSTRLLKKASQAYRVSLIPVEDSYRPRGLEHWMGDLSNYLALTSFERVMYLPPRGLVLDAEILDSLFAAPMSQPIHPLDGGHAQPHQSLLIEPSLSVSKRVATAWENQGEAILSNNNFTSVILPTSYLREVPDAVDITLDADSFYESTAYVRFNDPEIRGPEFDLERGTFARTQPSDDEMQVIWRNSYDHFRLMRMNYCGLDLRPLPKQAPNVELK